MATTMLGRTCKLLKVLSGIRHMQISHIQQPKTIEQMRSLWSGTVFNARKKANAPILKNDPAKPKMPANVFVMFLGKKEEEIKKNNPDLPRKGIIKLAAQMWQDLDPEEKSKFTLHRKYLFDKYKEDLGIYLRNMTPEQSAAEAQRKEGKASKELKALRKTLGMPTKPSGAFNIFVSEKFGERSGEVVPVYFKAIVDEWTKLSDADKEIYKEKAEKRKVKYSEDINKWENEMIALGRYNVVRKSTLKKIAQDKKVKKVKKNKVGFSKQEENNKKD